MPLLRTAEGEHRTDDRAKAETGFNPSALQSFEDTPIIETVQFTEGMVLTELLRLKESKSPGPHEIPAKILKDFAGELSKPLSMLFHTSFETGCLPPDWKSAWITPLYKGGSRVSANNYRPVSLTSICLEELSPNLLQRTKATLEQCLFAINKRLQTVEATLHGFPFRLHLSSPGLKTGCRTMFSRDKVTYGCYNVTITAILSLGKMKQRGRLFKAKDAEISTYINADMLFETNPNFAWMHYEITHFTARKPEESQIEDFRFGTVRISAIDLKHRLQVILAYASESTPITC
ncbi:hypothetical protein SprV_0902763800 [Sparganum proliferum]